MSVEVEPLHVNDVLKEIQQLLEQREPLEEQSIRIQARMQRQRRELDDVFQQQMTIDARVRKLIKVADLLEDDWRRWPWVEEAGFAKNLPTVLTNG